MKRFSLLTVLAVFFAISLHANVISFYIVETGLSLESEKHRSSSLWEDAFMDVFFDAGFIVTNYPMMRFESKPQGSIINAAGFDLAEAQEAGIDYILVAQLDYSNPSNGPDTVSFFVFKVSNHLIIYEKNIVGRNFRHERDAIEELRKIVLELVPVISMI